MSPKAQLIAIAKVSGYQLQEHLSDSIDGHCWHVAKPGQSIRDALVYTHNDIEKAFPKWLDSVDAIREVEKLLSHEVTQRAGVSERSSYAMELSAVLNPADRFGERGPGSSFQLIHAPAASRAKAILITLGLWDDSK